MPFEAIVRNALNGVAPYLQSFVPARMQQHVMQGPSLANLLQTPETQSLNLTVLRRIDSAITQVLRPSQVCETIPVAGDSVVSQVLVQRCVILSRTASSGEMLQVLACANHVALYDFDRVQHRWVRKFLNITSHWPYRAGAMIKAVALCSQSFHERMYIIFAGAQRCGRLLLSHTKECSASSSNHNSE